MNARAPPVSALDTVPPRVNYSDRKFSDRPLAVLYASSYVAFLACGLTIVSKGRARYSYDAGTGLGSIGSYFLDDARECCGDNGTGSVCACLYGNEEGACDSAYYGRRLAGSSKLNDDEGMFDAFREAPEILVGLLFSAVAIAVLWVVLLRYFAKPIVVFVELFKIAAFIYLGVVVEDTGSKVVCFLIAAGLAGYAYWAREQILFAAKIITYSTKAMKENPSILAGALLVKVLFAGNAVLFVLFFSKTIGLFEVQKEESMDMDGTSTTYCVFGTPGYVSGMWWYLSISYLWTVLYLSHMRLSIISTIVGSWHFHPEDRPPFIVVIKNTLLSCGTIAASSIVATIAEFIRRTFLNRSVLTWLNPLTYTIFLPIHILTCCFSGCLTTFVNMFSKFAVILHVFTGRGFKGSAHHVVKIMSRHFKGGVVTEVTSKSVLAFGSYAFSVALAAIALVWINDRFDCGATDSNAGWWIMYLLAIMSSVWYSVLGLYIIIILNNALQQAELTDQWWIPILAACFVGCLAMMFFTLLSGIFLDTINTLFLCFAIDKDNNVDVTDDELATLVKELPGYTEAVVISDFGDAEMGNYDDVAAIAVPVGQPVAAMTNAVAVDPVKGAGNGLTDDSFILEEPSKGADVNLSNYS